MISKLTRTYQHHYNTQWAIWQYPLPTILFEFSDTHRTVVTQTLEACYSHSTRRHWWPHSTLCCIHDVGIPCITFIAWCFSQQLSQDVACKVWGEVQFWESRTIRQVFHPAPRSTSSWHTSSSCWLQMALQCTHNTFWSWGKCRCWSFWIFVKNHTWGK